MGGAEGSGSRGYSGYSGTSGKDTSPPPPAEEGAAEPEAEGAGETCTGEEEGLLASVPLERGVNRKDIRL